MWARGVQRLVFLVLLLHLGAAQKKETYGGGTKSNFKDFEKEGLEAFTEEMEHMQEWWCVEKNHLGDELCDSYGKVGLWSTLLPWITITACISSSGRHQHNNCTFVLTRSIRSRMKQKFVQLQNVLHFIS